MVAQISTPSPAVDASIAARNLYNKNYNRNCFYSKCSTLVGLISLIGFGYSVYKFFISPVPAIGFAVSSFVLSQIWLKTRNREGYALQRALDETNEEKIIGILSSGANIYQKVWPCGGAAANLFPVLKGDPRTVLQWFAEKGRSDVVTYLAHLDPNLETRKQMATDAIKYADDVKTARVLMNLGGAVKGRHDLFYFCCLKNNLEVVKFFVQNGALLNAGIGNHKGWEEELRSTTPLEELLDPRRGNEPSKILETICPDPKVYKFHESARDLYNSLNKNGFRVRFRYVNAIYSKI